MKKQKKTSQRGKIIVKLKTKERNLNEIHNNCNTKYKHLTIDLRKLIEKWKKERKSNREIVRLLGKNHQTINNEIKRGSKKSKNIRKNNGRKTKRNK